MNIENSVAAANPILFPALEQSIVAVVLVDENNCVLFFNEAAERLWGYSRREVLGRNMRLLLPKRLQGAHGAYMQKNREGGQPKVVGMSREVLMERKSGEEIWAMFSLSKIDVSGRIHYLALVRDVSDEVALRDLNRELVIEKEESEQLVAQLVRYDTLTGLPNRSYLNQHVVDLISADDDQKHACFHLGLDRFKDINDTLGQAAGDETLVEVANRLRSHLGEDQFLARVDGSIFVLVIRDCGVRRAIQMAADLLRVVSAPIDLSGFSIELSSSIGISLLSEDCRDCDSFLQNAKIAMSQVQLLGGGDYLFFSAGMDEMARDRLFLGMALRRAIANNEMYLEYQPQICADTSDLYGVEALARWDDCEFGTIPPGKFINLAEEIGEIEALGRWALREACRQMSVWRSEGANIPVVSVNLSPLSFRSSGVPELIASLLEEYELPGESLTIEITENAAMELTPGMREVVHGIRALGVGLSIDDFGTGFSSLSNLANLPATEVKIDKSFVEKCVEKSRLQSLVIAVIGLGKNLGLTVVAEGVETSDQQELLKAHECPVLQGYLFSRPLAPTEIPKWIRRWADRPPAR